MANPETDLVEKVIEIEWVGEMPFYFHDEANRDGRHPYRFKIVDMNFGLLCLQNEVSERPHTHNWHGPVWVPITKIAAFKIVDK